MTGHGFRALASTILNEKGYSPDWIEAQLAHEDGDKIRSASHDRLHDVFLNSHSCRNKVHQEACVDTETKG